VYDENFHVPLIVCHPDVRSGATVDAMASAVDLAPTLLAIAGASDDEIRTEFPGLLGHNLLPALTGETVRDGVLTAVESITTLDASFWTNFSDPDIAPRIASGEVRPDWTHRGFLRGYTDERYTFGRYFSPLEPNRPSDLAALYANNDVVLYDRLTDPDETTNLAADPSASDLVASLNTKLEALIDAEVGDDTRAWVTERPNLLGWPTWNGDTASTTRAS
jgi:arylsulfatase